MDQQNNQPEQVQPEQVESQNQPVETSAKEQQPAPFQKPYSHQNPMVRMAVNTLAQAGFDPQDPLVQDAINGNTAGLARVLLQQGVKNGWDVIEALDANHKQQQEIQTYQQQTHAQQLTDAMGGKDRWAAIQEWAQKAGSPEEFAQVQQDLAAGGRTALRTAQWLETMYNAAGGQVLGQQETDQEKPINPAMMQSQPTKTYSPKEFRKELLRIKNTQGQAAADAFFLQYSPN
jgi:hypothetical protein|nr:MAG TPA: capsid assembly protein [Caudoviricetes sp.]